MEMDVAKAAEGLAQASKAKVKAAEEEPKSAKKLTSTTEEETRAIHVAKESIMVEAVSKLLISKEY